MLLSVVIGTALLAVLGAKFIAWLYGYLQLRYLLRKIPKHRAHNLPFLGHALALQGSTVDFLNAFKKLLGEDIVDKGDNLTTIWLGTIPIVMALSPPAAGVVLRSSENIEKSSTYDALLPWLGEGLLTSRGQKWKTRRRMLTPTFHFSILQDFLEVMNEQSYIFVEKLLQFSDTGKSFNIFHHVTLCALDIICETAMGKSIDAQKDTTSEYVHAIYRVSDIILRRLKFPWLHPDIIFNNTSAGKEFNRLVDEVLHKFTKSVIKDRLQEFDGNLNRTKKKRLAFLDMLIAMSRENDALTFSDIQEEVDTFMFEGHDTTTAGLSFALHLIGKHPEVQRKMQKEIDKVFRDDPDRRITMDDLKALEYTDAVLKESLRLFPSVPFIGRQLTEEIEIDGHIIPKGIAFMVAIYFVNRNPNYWKDALKFDPDRFLSSKSVSQEERNPYAYIPFSAGSRNCIGQRFALMEEKVMATYLLRRYNIESMDDTDTMPIGSDLILRPENGINVKLTKRKLID